ncbi:hypothetical protein GCM10010166_03070 [Couchioplanes caeruleus subsp. azureus]|nr:hypothetical protein GCM10010166_03070 [Couchioplanes caeruleus subsp. azureus]
MSCRRFPGTRPGTCTAAVQPTSGSRPAVRVRVTATPPGRRIVAADTLPDSGPHWPRRAGRERLADMTAAVDRRFVARRHVDYGRVRSAMCPAV